MQTLIIFYMVDSSESVNIEIDKVKQLHSIPQFFEMWNWVGDESVLVFKWMDLITKSKLNEEKSSDWSVEKLRSKYIENENFDKKSFFFLTHRSDTAGIAYIDMKTTIKFLLVNPKYADKKVEHALLTLIIDKAQKMGLTEIEFDKDTSTFKLDYLKSLLL